MRSIPLFSTRSGKLQGFGGLLAVFTEILVCRTWDAIPRRQREWQFHSGNGTFTVTPRSNGQVLLVTLLLPSSYSYRKLCSLATRTPTSTRPRPLDTPRIPGD